MTGFDLREVTNWRHTSVCDVLIISHQLVFVTIVEGVHLLVCVFTIADYLDYIFPSTLAA